MTSPRPPRAVAGQVRWWTPLLWLLVGTAGLIFAAWASGVDMRAAARRMADDLHETFHHSSTSFSDADGGRLEVEYDRHDQVRSIRHNGRKLDPADFVIEDGYLTVTALRYGDGELMYWRLPLERDGEDRETVRNPRWRMLLRVHPLAEGEPPGLRVARVGEEGAAARAGVRVGDIITGFDDQRFGSSAELEEAFQLAIAEHATGGILALRVERGGAEQTLRVELKALLTQAEWDAVTGIEDPVTRWLIHCDPSRTDDLALQAAVEQAAPGHDVRIVVRQPGGR